jgi:hypothetical protein
MGRIVELEVIIRPRWLAAIRAYRLTGPRLPWIGENASLDLVLELRDRESGARLASISIRKRHAIVPRPMALVGVL